MTGVYFLIRDNSIVYIGQTKDLKKRLCGHHVKHDKYRFIPCHKSLLNHYETRWLKKFRPIENLMFYGHHNPDGDSGRKPLFDVKNLKIGQKLRFPRRKEKYIYQYLNNFHKHNSGKKFEKVEENGELFIRRSE